MAQVHRYDQRVAISIKGSTRYMTADQARAMGRAMMGCADDIEQRPNFSRSMFATWHGEDHDIHHQDNEEENRRK